MVPGKVLVIGGNRGIGFNLLKTFAARGWTIIGSVRPQTRADSSDESVKALEDLGATILEIDTEDEATITKAAKAFGTGELDVLINCAGVGPNPLAWDEHTSDILMEKFRVNVVGPFLVTKYFLPNVVRSSNPKIINISSNMASIVDNERGRALGYRLSKTSVNQLTVSLSHEFMRSDAKLPTSLVTIVALHPGYIPTRMTGGTGPDNMEECVGQMVDTIERIDHSNTGQYLTSKGEKMNF